MEIFYVPLHILALLYAVWNILHADHMAFTWIRGKSTLLEEAQVAKYHRGTWIALVLVIITGSLAFFDIRAGIVYPQFYIKMGFVLALIINSFVIGVLSKIPTKRTWASLSTQERLPLLLSGAVSTISWIGAAIMALFITVE